MKRLALMMAMVALLISSQAVMAGSSDRTALMEKWRAEQAQQRKIDAALNALDMPAYWGRSGTTVQAGQRTLPWATPATKGSGN